MDGKKFLANFTLEPTLDLARADQAQDAEATVMEHDSLELLNLLYGLGEVHFVGEDTCAEEFAEDVIEVEAILGSAIRGILPRHNGARGRLERKKFADPLEKLNRDNVAEILEQEYSNTDAGLLGVTNRQLALAIVRTGRAVEQTGIIAVEDKAARMSIAFDQAREAFLQSRGDLGGYFERLIANFVLERHFFNGRAISTKAHEPALTTGGINRKWQTDTNEWDNVAATVAGKLVEFDTLAALNEWVVRRKLPYVPIVPPKAIEQGAYGSDKNPHADILLCSLAENDIVPIQIKYGVKQRARYINEMVFIGPEELKIQQVANGPVNVDGQVKTGQIEKIQVGAIAQGFGWSYKNGQVKKRRNSERTERYNEQIDTTLSSLDDVFVNQNSHGRIVDLLK